MQYIVSNFGNDITSQNTQKDINMNNEKNQNNNNEIGNDNNTIGNNYVFGYSASTINDNTINTLNSAEKSITVFNNDINTNLNPNRTLVEKSNVSNTINFIYPKNETLNSNDSKSSDSNLYRLNIRESTPLMIKQDVILPSNEYSDFFNKSDSLGIYTGL